MKLIFFGAAILAFLIAAAALGANVFKKPSAQELIAKNIPPCPFCGSLKFPPYYPKHNADWTIIGASQATEGVYRCEDCDKIWGPKSKKWLKKNNSVRDWDILYYNNNKD